MLKLYGSPISPRVNKLRYIANYIGLAYEHIPSSPLSGETRTPEFLKMHPAGKVPVIDDEGFYLFESLAIGRYLADKHGSAIYPKGLKERALVDQWCDFVTNHVEAGMVKVFFNRVLVNIPAFGATVDERSLGDGLAWLNRFLPLIESQLAQHHYLAGEGLTLADFALLSALDPAEPSGVSLDEYPALKAWQTSLQAQAWYSACHSSYADFLKSRLSGS